MSLWDYSIDQIINLITLAKHYKTQPTSTQYPLLQSKSSVTIFEKPSLRTRVTFEVAMNQLGGNNINLNSQNISLGKRETVEDAAKSLSRWVDAIILRTFKHKLITEFSQYATVPVINALSDLYHPCQALACAQTLLEKFKKLAGLTLVFMGDANNLTNSLAILCGKLHINFILSSPKGILQEADLVNDLKKLFTPQYLPSTT